MCTLFITFYPSMEPDFYGVWLFGAALGAAMSMLLYWVEVKLGWREWKWYTFLSRVTVGAVTRSLTHGLGTLSQLLWLVRARRWLEGIGLSAKLIRSAKYLLIAKGYFLNRLAGKMGLKEGKGWLYFDSWAVPIYHFLRRKLPYLFGRRK